MDANFPDHSQLLFHSDAYSCGGLLHVLVLPEKPSSYTPTSTPLAWLDAFYELLLPRMAIAIKGKNNQSYS